MKAVFYRRYGDASVLEYGELPIPKMALDGVLLDVKAAAVNPIDWKAREGYLDPFADVVFPIVPGADVSGVVREIGVGVNEFAVGDEVVGCVREDYLSRGSFAQVMPAPVRALAIKPPNLGWAEAAAMPLAALTSYQALVRVLDVQRGETVLIHGAAGGVGAVAVQIAVHLGARVIGTASERNHEFLRELGAEPVNYTVGLADSVRATAPDGVDVLLDAVGKRIGRTVLPLLAPHGRFASVVDPKARELGGSYVFTRPDTGDLPVVAALAAKGVFRVPVGAIFPLPDAAQAHLLSQGGHARGKVVVAVDEAACREENPYNER
ncbi:NADP-dependent oxidoreductase [Nocardia tengchongensis]|uniref:NADP-dependent oxidoreductase n=1 Tax=Nocardia tengchongensis TaxID=2055889 RepID=UPI003695DA71